MPGVWHKDWTAAKRRLADWWSRKGVCLQVLAAKAEPWEDAPDPGEPGSLERAYLDAEYRSAREHWFRSRTWHGAQTVPVANLDLGPGSLGTMLGSEPEFTPETVWYRPCIADPDSYPPIRFDPSQRWFLKHRELLQATVDRAQGRYYAGMPDLIENIDTLAQLRGNEELMMDLIERPDWVERRLWEINEAYFQAFDSLYEVIRDEEGGNAFCAFCLWGPGKTAKVQCDESAMFSEAMFRRFVVPPLRAQCEWLDYSMFHLDGTHCMKHLDALLEIEALDAIEWTPEPTVPGGGDPCWYDLYRRILSAGKSVQVLAPKPEEVGPLLDAIGTDGVMLLVWGTEEDAERLERLIG
ncbi:MAG: hypothetical protein ACK41F_02745 [Fimbriimonadaceae bacterium]